MSVEIKEDLVERLSQAAPVKAISELIWNSLDGDATEVDVNLIEKDLGNGLSQIIVQDNGRGFSYTDASNYFKNLGGSWKRQTDKTLGFQRKIHGREGRGRYKALALGSISTWEVCFKTKLGNNERFTIVMSADDYKSFLISEPTKSDLASGVNVKIENLHKGTASITSELAVQNLTEIFAPYLVGYKDVKIRIGKTRLDPQITVENVTTHALNSIEDQNRQVHKVELQIIEWKNQTERTLYLCSEDGFPQHQIELSSNIGDYNFSAYIRSSYISTLVDTAQLGLAEMDKKMRNTISQAKNRIQEQFRTRTAEKARRIVEDWKKEQIYPFQGESDSPLAEVERQVFDIVAVNLQNFTPDFENAPKKARKLQLHLLRSAIESSPNDLQKIISEVMQLSRSKQREFAELLEETTLSAIIQASKTVTNRLKFIAGLEEIVFETEKKKRLKERSQLHRILVENTWILGEKYNLWVSDGDLTRVLEKYKEHLNPEIQIDKPVALENNKRGIIDLMLSRQIKLQNESVIENLVIELKAPRIKLNSESIMQIQKYAHAVTTDERFHTLIGVKWDFWLISNDYDEVVANLIAGGPDPSKRLILDNRQKNVRIGIKSWSEIIAENRDRLEFFQKNLEYKVDKSRAIQYLRERHAEFLQGVV